MRRSLFGNGDKTPALRRKEARFKACYSVVLTSFLSLRLINQEAVVEPPLGS